MLKKLLQRFLATSPQERLIQAEKPIGALSAARDFNPKTREQIEFLRAQTIQRTHGQDLVPGLTMDGLSGDGGASVYQLESNVVPVGLSSWYAKQSFIGYQMCATLAQHWLINKACTMPARDAIRNGYELTVNDGSEVDQEMLSYVRQMDKKMNLVHNLTQFVRMGRIFGIRVVMFKVVSTDPEYYEKPFNPDGITPGSYKGIVQIDPYWITPQLDQAAAADPTSLNFFEPTYWNVQGQKIHHSHLIIFKGDEVPDVLKPSYYYGGLSVPQKIYERVYSSERTANEAPLLAMSKRLITLKTDIEEAIGNQEKFEEALNQFSYYMNNFGVKVLGEGDEMTVDDLSLADLDQVIMTQYQLVSAIAGVPATKLLGTSPKGFDSSGTAEQDSYHEELETIQSNDMERLLDRHYMLLIRSHVAPKFKKPVFEFDIAWNPVSTMTAQELADLNDKKATTAKTLADIGAIDGFDERKRITADKDSGYTGLPMDEGFEDDDLEGLMPDASPDEITTQKQEEKTPISETMLNGAQIKSLVDVVNSVANKEISRESGVEILMKALSISKGQAQRLLGDPSFEPSGETAN